MNDYVSIATMSITGVGVIALVVFAIARQPMRRDQKDSEPLLRGRRANNSGPRRAVITVGDHKMSRKQINATGQTPTHVFDHRSIAAPAFIGRDDDLRGLCELCQSSRLVNLTGAAGVGKTTIATKMVQQLHDRFAGNIWTVSFANLPDETLLLSPVLDTLMLKEKCGKMGMAALIDALRNSRSLLIFDDCDLFALSVTQLVSTLAAECSDLHALVISCDKIELAGAVRFQLAPMPTIDRAKKNHVKDLSTLSSTTLFVEQLRQKLPSFKPTTAELEQISDICHLASGDLRAIVLAARYIGNGGNTFFESVTNVLQPLSAGPSQGSSETAIDKVLGIILESIPEMTRAIAGRLSLLHGSFSVDEAAVICADIAPLRETFDAEMLVLAQNGMVKPVSDSIARQFFVPADLRTPIVRKTISDSAALRAGLERALCSMLPFVQRLSDSSNISGNIGYEDDCASHELIRSILFWALSEPSLAPQCLSYVAALWRNWKRSGQLTEGVFFCQRATSALETSRIGSDDIAEGLFGTAVLTLATGNTSDGGDMLFRALGSARITKNKKVAAYATAEIGALTANLGDPISGTALVAEGLNICREIGDNLGIARASVLLGELSARNRQLETARLQFEGAYHHAKDAGDRELMLAAAANLGSIYDNLGDCECAEHWATQASALAESLGDHSAHAKCFAVLSNVARVARDFNAALAFASNSLVYSKHANDIEQIGLAHMLVARTKLDQRDTFAAQQSAGEALQAYLRLGGFKDLAVMLELFAAIFAARQEYTRAVQVMAAAGALRDTSDQHMGRWEASLHEKTEADCKLSLTPKAYDAASASGSGLSMTDAISLVEIKAADTNLPA